MQRTAHIQITSLDSLRDIARRRYAMARFCRAATEVTIALASLAMLLVQLP